MEKTIRKIALLAFVIILANTMLVASEEMKCHYEAQENQRYYEVENLEFNIMIDDDNLYKCPEVVFLQWELIGSDYTQDNEAFRCDYRVMENQYGAEDLKISVPFTKGYTENCPLEISLYFDKTNRNIDDTSIPTIWTDIDEDEVKTYLVEDDDIPVTKIFFEAEEDIEDAQIIMSSLSGAAENTKNLGENIVAYEYLNIRAQNIGNRNLDNPMIYFTVPRRWLSVNDIDMKHVRMYRYIDNNWNELGTEIIDKGTTEIAYRAISPGLSYFAIAGESIMPADDMQDETDTIEQDTREQEDAPKNTEPISQEEPISAAVIASIVGILVLLAVVIGLVAYNKK